MPNGPMTINLEEADHEHASGTKRSQNEPLGGVGGRTKRGRSINSDINRGDFSVNEDEKISKYELILEDETMLDKDNNDENMPAENYVPRALDTSEEAFVLNVLRTHFEDVDEEIYACGGMRECDRLDVLELCCEEDSLLTKTIQQLGGRAERAGLFNGCDLMKASGREKVKEIIKVRKPRWIWVSYPCGPNSTIQHLNELTEDGWLKSMKRRQKCRKLIRYGNEILLDYVNAGGNVAWEWPRNNDGWHLSEVRSFWQQMDFVDHNFDGCMFNLRCHEGFHKKPWTVRTNRNGVFHPLERQCDGSHRHLPSMGGTTARKTGLYTVQLCTAAAKCMLSYHETDYSIFTLDSVKIDRESLKTMTTQELERLALTVLKLHRRCGHPSNRALVKTLAARNADPKMLAIAEQLKCDECQEGQFSKPSVVVSLEKEEKIWNTLQMDIFFFKHGTNVHHFLVMLDEASGFSITAELLIHTTDIHANVDTPSVIEGLEGSWFQYFGHPGRIRCDLEGAFRGTELADYCADRGIELLQVPAEHHQATGDVERMVGELRHKIELFLRNEDVPPRRAVYAMTTAHNHLSRVGGFAPAQWAFGRQVDDLDNVAIHTSEGTADHAMSDNLQLRLRAEKKYLELHARAKISRALNTRGKPSVRFLPGDLVFYKRYKVPSDFPAHELVDQPRLRISRWYGPGRVLASETRVQEEGTRRTAASTVWVVAQGRMKKFHLDQLRHASERERLIAEQTTAPTMPWTRNALESLIQKGAYDDHTCDFQEKNPNKSQRRAQQRSRTPAMLERKRLPRPADPGPPPQPEPQEVQMDQADGLLPGQDLRPEGALQPELPSSSSARRDPENEPVIDGRRLLMDVDYNPLKRIAGSEAQPGDETFRRQRRQHELDDRPLHVKRQELIEASNWCCEVENDFVYGVEIPIPENEAAWRKILKDPCKFAAKSVQKGAEVSWHKLDAKQREAMQAAKLTEVDQWVKEEVCQKFKGIIPAGRLMRMRWVLTLKSTSDPSTAKCKARIVLLGYTDPDLETLQTSAPTLTRRSRQLALSLACAKRWKLVKADAKSAFLQGTATQSDRNIFAIPVPELAEALQVPQGQAVKMLKAAYGLVSAPREWFLEVNKVATESCKLRQLKSDPCMWVLDGHGPEAEPRGFITSHVDDFLIAGDDNDPEWQACLSTFKAAFRWSPWENTPFQHCGVMVDQLEDFSFQLGHDEYCTEIKQIDIIAGAEGVSPTELAQARAVLGAAQWRALQTAPQHAAKVSLLQSMLPHALDSKDVLHQINKLCRELYAQRYISVNIKQLNPKNLRDLGIVCWTDAAVGNRPDLSSTGGFIAGMVCKGMLSGQRGCVNPLAWRSGRLPRIARSSLAAEIQALAEGEQEFHVPEDSMGRIAWDPSQPERTTPCNKPDSSSLGRRCEERLRCGPEGRHSERSFWAERKIFSSRTAGGGGEHSLAEDAVAVGVI